MVATAFKEVVSHDAETHAPRPLHVVVIEGDSEAGPTTTTVRIWTEADADACRLCLSCTAQDGPRGVDRDGRPTLQRICSHSFLGLTDPDDRDSVELFSPDGLSPSPAV